MAIVYRHTRLDNHEVFYVGIGKTEKRAYDKSSRSRFWKNIALKHGHNVELLAKDLSWEDACELECLLIEEYGRKDLGTGQLVNMTDGGDGVKGHSPEAIKKMRAAHIGRVQSKEEIAKRVAATTGKKRTAETKRKQSEAAKGRVFTKEHRKNLSIAHLGLIPSNAKKVKSITTGIEYESLRDACMKNDLNYKTEHMRMTRNPNSPKNKFIFI